MYDRNFPRFLYILACIVVNCFLVLRFLSSLFFPAKQEEEIEQEPKVQEENSNEEEPSYTFSDDFDIDEAYANADYETRQSFDYKLWKMEKEEEARLFGEEYPRRSSSYYSSYLNDDNDYLADTPSNSDNSIPKEKNEGWYENTDYEDPADMYDDDDKF